MADGNGATSSKNDIMKQSAKVKAQNIHGWANEIQGVKCIGVEQRSPRRNIKSERATRSSEERARCSEDAKGAVPGNVTCFSSIGDVAKVPILPRESYMSLKTAIGLSKFGKELIRRVERDDTFVGSFNEAAVQLFRLQYEGNSAYRTLCEAAKIDVDEIKDWREIPAAPTVAFKELELTSIPPGERSTVFHSSGTTEQRPSRHFHSSESLAVYEASLLAGFKAQFTTSNLRMKLLSLTPPKIGAPNSSLVHMFDVVIKEFGSKESRFLGRIEETGRWGFDSGEVGEALRRASAAGEPVGLVGTAFLFVDLLERVQVRLPEGSRVLETGGYKGRSRTLPKAELYSLIGEHLGVPESGIVSEYGMCELSSQAYARQSVYQFSPWARVLIVSPETGRPVAEGETGLVRVIDLANVWSVLAVQTEDLGVRRGDGFELLGRVASAEARGCSLMSG